MHTNTNLLCYALRGREATRNDLRDEVCGARCFRKQRVDGREVQRQGLQWALSIPFLLPSLVNLLG